MPSHNAFQLEPVPPFRLDLTVWVLRRRPDNIVDRWDGRTYRRVLAAEDHEPFEIGVSQSGPSGVPRLQVSISGQTSNGEVKEMALSAVGRLLGFGLDLGKFYLLADSNDDLRPLADRFRGFKPPRFPTPFEALVNAIACQQLSLTVGIRLLNRLAEAYGPAVALEDGIFRAFPRPQDLANVSVEELREMGFSYQKARYITELARSITSKQLNLEEIEPLDDRKAVDRLRSLKGVGRWTAEYFLLRGLGRTHIFPGDDVGARNNLQRWLNLPGAIDYDKVHKALRAWDSYGGLIYFHLLLKSLVEKEAIVN